MRLELIGWLALVALLASAGCDEQVKKEPAASANTAPKLAPSPAASPIASVARQTPPKVQRKKKTVKDCPPGPAVALGDKPTEEEIRRKLAKPTGTITRADLAKLKSLDLSQSSVVELDPCVISFAKNLKALYIGPGELDDLSPLAELTKLESLRASINKVEDLKPLEKLTRLDRLDLGRTQVEDLTPLAALTNLTELALDDTHVSDLKPLAKLSKLERLSLQRTYVKDFSPLKDLKSLKFLYIAGTPATDVKVLEPLRQRGTKIIDQ